MHPPLPQSISRSGKRHWLYFAVITFVGLCVKPEVPAGKTTPPLWFPPSLPGMLICYARSDKAGDLLLTMVLRLHLCHGICFEFMPLMKSRFCNITLMQVQLMCFVHGLAFNRKHCHCNKALCLGCYRQCDPVDKEGQRHGAYRKALVTLIPLAARHLSVFGLWLRFTSIQWVIHKCGSTCQGQQEFSIMRLMSRLRRVLAVQALLSCLGEWG